MVTAKVHGITEIFKFQNKITMEGWKKFKYSFFYFWLVLNTHVLVELTFKTTFNHFLDSSFTSVVFFVGLFWAFCEKGVTKVLTIM